MVSIWVEGVEELNRVRAELRAAGGRVGGRGAQIVRAHGAAVEAVAKGFAPVDTGALRSSISSEYVGDGRFAEMEAVIGPEVHYGRYVEFGTSRMAPQAFMGPALDRVAPQFVAATKALGDLFGGG